MNLLSAFTPDSESSGNQGSAFGLESYGASGNNRIAPTSASRHYREMHSTQQSIRELCQKLLDTPENSLDFYALADDLRAAIHEHIEDLRVLTHTLPISPKDLS